MGDGGVACVPLQHIMDRFSNCGGKNGKLNSSESLKFTDQKMKMKPKRGELEKSELGGKCHKEAENGQICREKVAKEEVEEGELGTLKWPRAEVENGEFIPERTRKFEIKSEIEKGETVADKWRKGEVEKGEFVARKWRKGEVEKREFNSGRLRNDDASDRTEIAPWRVKKDELEKGEFIPGRWRKTNDYSHSKVRRHDHPKNKGWKYENERTPPPGKYSGEKEFSRSGGQHSKWASSRWETSQERPPRISSKIVDEEGNLKTELSNGKNHGREHSSGSRLKRHVADSDSINNNKHHYEFGNNSSSKSRRLSDDSNRSAYSDHYSRHSVERSYRNPSSFRNISSDRYSSRHNESSLSSRAVHDRRNSSPRHSERSPRDRTRYHDHRDRSPIRRHRNRSPSYLDRSPHDQDRYHDTRNRSPNILDRSPLDRCRQKDHHEGGGKTGSCEKRQSQSDKGQEEKSLILGKDSEETKKLDNGSEKDANKEEKSQSPRVNCKESPQANGFIEELLSMEEDMDICDTPPHVPMVADSSMGKWFYLDDFGLEQGPSRLGDIKTLVEEGYLVSDHLIKHLDCDRWVTVENAVSPLITSNFQSVVSDTVTQLVSPPEAPGNVLVDNGDIAPASFPDPLVCSPDSSSSENFHIDERVGAMFEGFAAIPGKELEAVGEVLQMTFEHGDWERWKTFEGVTWQQTHTGEAYDQTNGGIIPRVSEFASKETSESVLAPSDKDNSIACGDPSEWFYDGWSCKGGDWKRDDEIGQDKSWKKKIVLNDGYPLCQMPGSRCEDPRLNLKEELYYPSHSKRLDLPAWAFSSSDEWTDSVSRSGPIKPLVRGLKGSILPVVRINACVVKDHGSFVSESRVKIKKERSTLRSTRPYSTTSDAKRSSDEGISRLRHMHDKDSHGSSKSTASFRIPKDRICTIDDLQLHFGGWYYLDGAGHEQGPLSFAEMRVLADQGIIPNHSSAFRKLDKVWVPVTSTAEASEEAAKPERENSTALSDISGASLIELRGSAPSGSGSKSSSFHSLHPQFLGYTRGKLHELVMKSYKSREFAAAINEVLDPWINARQPKKEIEKHMYNHTADSKFQKSDQSRAGKRARLLADESDEEYEMEDDIPTVKKDGYLFDDICGDATFSKDANAVSEVEKGHWGLLDGRVLARVFHFLNVDIKSFVNASLACKHWRTVVSVYKDISRQLDLSAVAASCTDSTIWSMLNGYNKEKITSLLLRSCTDITPSKLEEILRLFPSISFIDIRGCSQLEDLPAKFPNINWVKSRGSHLKVRSLSEITETALSVSKTYNGLGSQMDGSSGLRDYLESSNKRDSANQLFRRSLYKRSKLFDARKSSSILSRDAHLRRWAIKKSENGYKRMEEFLASSLKDIMKENTFDFFVPKVAEIEDRVKSGYYAGHGLNSLKEDISRMCRDAIKTKNRSDSRDMNHIISLFIRLATSLDGSSKYSYDRHDMLKTLKNISPPGFSSSSTKYKKNIHKVTDRKHMNRSDVSSVVNSSSDYGDYASDREIRRRLSKLNKKSSNYGSETCNDRSSGETVTDSDSTSDTGSDSDIRSEAGTAVKADSRGDAAYFRVDDGLDTLADDREWGARMTKLSLVPPVTRKYEVIDHYVIVADEEEVRRKMQVSLPDDYAEKLCAQKNGTEESDMEIPEVKDFKPRKQLGDEVIEQEVYGIDPYTHNLLLDSMPDESDWSLLDKHLFIEDELLCTLNKRVRHFTNTGNTPMVFPLKPVVEHILKTAEEEHNKRTMRLCQFMLKAIDGRPEDKYVAYRKGLGVVCNKEGGFGEDDFVVEFLGEVYPAWKWFEKQDGIRSLQKNSNEPAPEFYNIYLERPKGDADGYDLVVVDAMHKANYASRICHSCRPNCEAKVTSVDGHYQIGIYSVRPIRYGEEITFDYNSVTESKEEYEASVCLCGSQVCRGSYLNLTGEDAFQMVLKECHGVLDRHRLLLEACEVNSVSEEDYIDLGKAGLGSCLLGGLPDWLIAYSARLVRFINFERTKLPEEILRHNLEEKRKYFADICLEVEKSDAEVQAEGVYNQRLQNLALTLDKVRYVIRCVFGDPKKAHPPLEKLSPEGAVSYIWKGEGSLVEELIQCIAPHMEDGLLNDLKSKVRAHDPSGSDDISKELRKSLIWLRDEIRNLPCTYKCRHDAAADLIHLYAYTKCFFRVREYKAVTSPPVYISPLDLGPKYADKLGLGSHEFRKTYGENYCLGQLIYWHNQANAEPDCTLDRASRGCLSLPDVASFYAKVQKPSRQRVYGPRTVKFMLARMEKQRQRPWPKDRIWSFKNHQKIFGSPMLDSVLDNGPLSREMTYWLKHRPSIFQAMWDR